MVDKDDGGPAFPMGNPEQGGYDGMTKRDWFAGQALSGLCANHGYIAASSWDSAPNNVIVNRAYALADAMIAARKDTSNDR